MSRGDALPPLLPAEPRLPGPATDLPVRFGRYELVDHLATGGMAEVYLARSFGADGFQKHLVVKRLRDGLQDQAHLVRLFVQEARVGAGLVHPNIVPIHELGVVPGPFGPGGRREIHYIAMEYVHGVDLARLRRSLTAADRRLAPSLAVHCAVEVLRALAYAHGRADPRGRPMGLVHRDVSPHNVLVGFQGEVKLLDFGIARLPAEAGDKLPGFGGKFAYMSPEQASGGPVDGKSDVFSTGIVLWELLVGHRLFQHPDPGEKLRRVQEAWIPEPAELGVELPPGLWAVLSAMLARAPEDRPDAALAVKRLRALGVETLDAPEALVALMAELFPEAARRDPGGLNLGGLAGDLARLSQAAPPPGEPEGLDLTDPGGAAAPPVRPPARARAWSADPAARGLASGERKAVVVVVAEVMGFTALSRRQDSEVVARAHYRLLRALHRVVDRHGGWLDRFRDDRFTVFFGVPRAGEHDLDRALACAAQLVREARRLRRKEAEVHLAVGVHMGELSVGRIAIDSAPRRLRYLAIGDTTKLALRLSQAAQPDEVRVSERVASLARRRFRFQEAEALRRRDKGVDLSFRLVGRDTSVAASAGSWASRGDELLVLGRALRKVSQGERVVLAIRGPAGTGKSRLLQELRDLARSRGVPVYSARAVPYTADRPLATLRDLVVRLLGLPPEADVEQLRVAFEGLTQLGIGREDLAVLLDIFEQEPAAVDPSAWPAMSRLLLRLTEGGPILLAIEDAQHLSRVERRILRFVLQDAPEEMPLLLLLTLRGRLSPALGRADAEIVLGPLAPPVERALVAHLAGARTLSPALEELIQRRAEGNPRYIEAIVEALLREGQIELVQGQARLVGTAQPERLPESLEGLLAARIDGLDPPLRHALQVAAILGLRFPPAWLAISLGEAAARALVPRLLEEDLLTGEGDSLWFSSELVWQVTHRRMLAARRRELHGLVARELEARLGEEGPHLEALAAHCAGAGRMLDAARHGDRLGDQHRREQRTRPAIRAWIEALGWLTRAAQAGAPGSACLRGEAVLHRKVGEALGSLGEGQKAELHLQAALDAATESTDLELESLAMLELARLHAARGEESRARAHLELVLDTLHRVGADQAWALDLRIRVRELMARLEPSAVRSIKTD